VERTPRGHLQKAARRPARVALLAPAASGRVAPGPVRPRLAGVARARPVPAVAVAAEARKLCA
jgi:hypothetical protein